MRKTFAYFFLSCSLVLVLGHSIMPHNHIENEHSACEITAVKDLSIAEILKLALTHNLGANHLEEFKNCKKLEFTQSKTFNDFISHGDIIYNEEMGFPQIENNEATYCHSLPLDFILKNAPLRAPPARS